MTFPDRKYHHAPAFIDDYFVKAREAARSVNRFRMADVVGVLNTLYKHGGTLFVCGNGGSAAIANTFVCDHAKCIQTDTKIVPRVVSLSTDISMITAIANDFSYDDIFVYQLWTMARLGDVLITISASGDSENVVRAADWAHDNGVTVIAFTGFSGGRTAKLADVNVHVDADNYGVIEDTHQSLMHILAQYIRQAHMDEDLIADRKF